MLEGGNFIFTGLQPWDISIGSNAKDIALEVSKHNRVLYVNTPLDKKTIPIRINHRNLFNGKMSLPKSPIGYDKSIRIYGYWIIPSLSGRSTFCRTDIYLIGSTNLTVNACIHSLEVSYRNFISMNIYCLWIMIFIAVFMQKRCFNPLIPFITDGII